MRPTWMSWLELFFPSCCESCGASTEGGPLCATCRARLPWLPQASCERCEIELSPPWPRLCARCTTTESPLVACRTSVAFGDAAEHWIHRFKYPGRCLAGLDPGPRAVVCDLVRESARRMSRPPPDEIVPIPLHPNRLRSRGFNPAAVLAREVASELSCRWTPDLLTRVRDTPSQTELDRRQRRRNVAGAFVARRRPPPHVWLVDDVVTTGSTLESAARALRAAGAREVAAVCIARVPLL